MNASSRTTALNIVADMLRKLNVSPLKRKLTQEWCQQRLLSILYAYILPMFVFNVFFVWFLLCLLLFNTFFICFSWTRPCYVLNVKSFVAFVNVLHCRQAAKQVYFAEPLSARAALVAAAPLWRRPAANAAAAAAGRSAMLPGEPVWLACNLARTYLSALLNACAAYRTLSVCQGHLSCDTYTNNNL